MNFVNEIKVIKRVKKYSLQNTYLGSYELQKKCE